MKYFKRSLNLRPGKMSKNVNCNRGAIFHINFSQRGLQYRIAIWKQHLQIVWRGRYVANHELSLVIKFQFQLIGLRPREGVHLLANGSQAAARLREKRPAANRPAKNPTNGWKKASRRSGVGYLYPDTRLIFTVLAFIQHSLTNASLFYRHF